MNRIATRPDAPATLIALGLVLALAPRPGGIVAAPDGIIAAPADGPGSGPDPLTLLFTGSPAERLEAAEDPFSILATAGPGGGGDDNRYEPIIDALVTFLRLEPDEWISRQLLSTLVFDEIPGINRLFRAALASGSNNIAGPAVEQFTLEKDPESAPLLEDLWREGIPDWLRPRLVEALANQASTCCLADFLRLARDDDPELSLAAINALATIGDPEAIPVLVRASRSGRPGDRAAAIRALGTWPGSAEARDTILGASRSTELSLKAAAIQALGKLRSPEGDSRLVAILESDPDEEDLRGEAAEAIAGSDHPGATTALVRLLHDPQAAGQGWLVRTILRVLHNRDDATAVAGLQDLDLRVAGAGDLGLAELIGYLGRERIAGDRTEILTTSCAFGVGRAADDPATWHVEPPPPLHSIRCWSGPDLPGDPAIDDRIPAGALVGIEDHFDRPGEPWVEVDGREASFCWVPLRFLARGPAPPAPAARPGDPLRVEFDLEAREAGSLLGLRLQEAGLLEIIEPGDSLVGLALTYDRRNESQTALIEAARQGHSPLAEAIARIHGGAEIVARP